MKAVDSMQLSVSSEELPSNWLSIELSKAVIYSKGKKPRTLSSIESEGLIPYIDIKAFEKGIIDEYADIKSSKVIDENDILVVWDGARFGLTGMGVSGAAGSTLMVLKPVLCYPKYIYSFINRYYSYINSKPKGTGTPHVNPDIFWNLPFPIAPLNEQKRIVAKLDAIMPRIEAVKARLDKVPGILKRFRQSVLTAAVTGKLTEQWRQEHPEVESAEDCLKILINKRMSDFNQQILTAKINKLPKPQIPNYLNYSFDRDTEKNNELPTTWIISKVGLLCDCIVPGRDKPKSFTGSIPWITLPNISGNELNNHSGTLRLSDSEIKEVNARVIPKESVVMCCVGNFGISAVVNDPIVINQQLHAFVKSEIIISKYLMYHLKTLKEYQESIATSTTIAYLNKTNCNSLPINLPPLEEQKEIVRQVDKLFALANKVESHYQKAKARVDKLSQSVLAKAFRGELVPQDPNDLPAAELLKQILAEKDKMAAQLKKRKTKNVKQRK